MVESITDDNIIEFYNSQKNDPNAQENIRKAISDYGLDTNRVSAVLSQYHSKWSIDAADFKRQVDPYMNRSAFSDYEKQMGGRYSGGGEGGDFIPYSDKKVNSWRQGKVDEGMTLTLADGRKWVPAGGDAGVTFHPATPAVPASGDGENYVPAQPAQEAYYSVIGDASNLNPNQKGGEQRIIVNYKQVGDRMVPVGEPVVEGYKHGFYNQNKGLVNFGVMAATMGAGAMAAGAGAAAGVGGSAGIGSGTVLGGGAATAASASGAAGMMGMAPGMAATAVNTGLLSTGVSLAQGHNLQDSIKTGITSGALSGFGGWASDTIGSATSGLGATTSKALSTVGSGALTGGATAALTGQNIGSGIRGGVVTSGLRAVGGWASKEVEGVVGNDSAGRIAGGIVNSAITKTSPLGVLVGEVTGKVDGFGALSAEQQKLVNSVVAQAIKGKRLSPSQIIRLATSAARKVKQS